MTPDTAHADQGSAPTAEIPVDALQALARLRREAEAEIERLLDFLDELDPDPDIEPDGDELDDDREDDEDDGDLEPSFGASETHPNPYWDRYGSNQSWWGAGKTKHDELEPSFGEPRDEEREDDPAEMGIGDAHGLDSEAELSLGATDSEPNQVIAWRHSTDELEDVEDHEDELDNNLDDLEPSLGSLESSATGSQTGWHMSSTTDLEADGLSGMGRLP